MKQRWYLKWLWLKHSYFFRWAHKPLCGRYEHDLARVGKMHVCRSCLCVYLTFILGSIAGVFSVRVSDSLTEPLAVAACFAIVLLGSFPRWYKRWPRWTRDLLRGGMGLCLAMTLLCLLAGNLAWGLVLTLSLIGFWRHYLRKRARRRHHGCDGCPELGRGICSGYRLQAEGVRRYESAATEWILTFQKLPPIKQGGGVRLPSGPVLQSTD